MTGPKSRASGGVFPTGRIGPESQEVLPARLGPPAPRQGSPRAVLRGRLGRRAQSSHPSARFPAFPNLGDDHPHIRSVE